MDGQTKLETENLKEKEVKILSDEEKDTSEDINIFFQKTVKNTISAFFSIININHS